MASGRSWPRRRPRIELRASILAAFVLVVASSAAAQPTRTDDGADDAHPGVLDRFLDEVKTLRADFEQESWTADERLLEAQSGRLALERPSKFRWHYEARLVGEEWEPFEQLVVADGKNLWIHDVELATATVTPLDDNVASTPAMLLSGDRAVRDGFEVVEEYGDDGLSWVRLEPEIEGTDFRSVLLGFEELTPRRLELVDGLGQLTRITLANVELNAELEANLFRFDRPRGVDVIGTPAR